MRQITGLTTDIVQTFKIRTEAGDPVITTLRYMLTIKRWFIDIEYKKIILRGYKVLSRPNLLSAYNMPFGIAVVCKGTPCLIDDFSSGRVKLYLFDKADLHNIN